MNEKRTVSYTREALEALPDKTDWKALETLDDNDIDYSDNPATDAAFWINAEVKLPKPKKGVYIRLDQDILDWLKNQGTGYQTRINAILRQYVEAHQRK